jgi:hypothetical protein
VCVCVCEHAYARVHIWCFYIIIILGISFMQGIYTYIPETNHAPREHRIAVILVLLFIIIIIIIIIKWRTAC